MPTYVYECNSCSHRFEEFHSMSDESPRVCPECGGETRRVPSAGAGLLFKGSGFYITDYRSNAYQEKAKQEKPAGGTGEKKPAAGGTSEKKPAPDAGGGAKPSGSTD